MTDPFAKQIIFATMAEPQTSEAQVAGWGPATTE
jgi:hypothetical protein